MMVLAGSKSLSEVAVPLLGFLGTKREVICLAVVFNVLVDLCSMARKSRIDTVSFLVGGRYEFYLDDLVNGEEVAVIDVEIRDKLEGFRLGNDVVSASGLFSTRGDACALVVGHVPPFRNGTQVGPGVISEKVRESRNIGRVAVEVASNESGH